MRSKLYFLAIFLLPAAATLGQSDHMEHHFDPKESAKALTTRRGRRGKCPIA